MTVLVTMLVGACGTAPARQENFEPMPPVRPANVRPVSGAIFQSGTELRLFEDLKAGRVGDILTVRLVEQTSASKNADTKTSKSTAATLANPTIFGRPITNNGVSLFQGSLSGEQSFDGSGASSQSNSLQGDITVTVVERLQNGNLRIRGEKWVTLNQGKEFIQLSGIIRPYDVDPGNTVLSSKVADAHITYSSKGALAAANRMGPIARFFNSIFHPY